MKTLMNILILFVLLIFVSCCKTSIRYSLHITNNSNDPIGCYFYLTWEGGSEGIVYPDTTLMSLKINEVINIKPKQTHYASRPLSPITEWILSLPNDTLSVFFFSQDSLKIYSWEKVRQEYKILQRYDISIENLKALLNQYGIPEIPYPPDERMKDMKMYPPYNGDE